MPATCPAVTCMNMTLIIISLCRVVGLILTESSDTLHIRERKPIQCNNTYQAFVWLARRGTCVGTQTLSERINRLTVLFNRANRVPWYVPCLLLLRCLIVSTMILTISDHANKVADQRAASRRLVEIDATRPSSILRGLQSLIPSDLWLAILPFPFPRPPRGCVFDR